MYAWLYWIAVVISMTFFWHLSNFIYVFIQVRFVSYKVVLPKRPVTLYATCGTIVQIKRIANINLLIQQNIKYSFIQLCGYTFWQYLRLIL